MENDFSLAELRIMQYLAPRKSYEDIADILGRDLTYIRAYLQHFVRDNKIVAYQQRIDEKQKLKEKEKEWKQLSKRKAEADAETVRARKKELHRIHRAREAEISLKRNRTQHSFANRNQDYSLMVSVRIDSRTIVFAKRGEDHELVKRKYLQNLESYAAPVSPASKNVHISKFKPIK